MSNNAKKLLDKLSAKVLKANLNGITSILAYQPEVPENAKQYLNKKENDK
ncbi:MAG: cyclic lactone autoinducer peptide [Clostridia bacterium]|nr:cyclic lactone autoinducer peptide [Clostridia bacterium]